MDSFFRRFFGDHSGFHRDSFDAFDDIQGNNGSNDVISSDQYERFGSPSDLFQHMEDMFNKIFTSSFSNLGFSRFEDRIPQEQNPRSIMLKDYDEDDSTSLFTKDFDESGVLSFNPGKEPFKRSHTFSKFSSVKTILLPDGTVEEHRTIIDSDGKKTTTVRHSIGDSSHEVITQTDDQGIKEKEEIFTNMDENELPEFEQTWSKLRGNSTQETESPSLTLPPSSPTYLYLLKKIFGSSKKEELESC